MSNPNYIGIVKNKQVYYVYCHGGCKLDDNGRTLYENYKTTEQVEDLLQHGGMSYLTEKPENRQYYKFWKGRTHYGTWAVDKNRRPKIADSRTPCYLWNGTEWLYSAEDSPVWIPLAAVFQNQLNWC